MFSLFLKKKEKKKEASTYDLGDIYIIGDHYPYHYPIKLNFEQASYLATRKFQPIKNNYNYNGYIMCLPNLEEKNSSNCVHDYRFRITKTQFYSNFLDHVEDTSIIKNDPKAKAKIDYALNNFKDRLKTHKNSSTYKNLLKGLR